MEGPWGPSAPTLSPEVGTLRADALSAWGEKDVFAPDALFFFPPADWAPSGAPSPRLPLPLPALVELLAAIAEGRKSPLHWDDYPVASRHFPRFSCPGRSGRQQAQSGTPGAPVLRRVLAGKEGREAWSTPPAAFPPHLRSDERAARETRRRRARGGWAPTARALGAAGLPIAREPDRDRQTASGSWHRRAGGPED